ncbi:hypothetical protein FB451DRAFT_1251518 [Mycena latifolia]|nr:hypothetical protein FB451DRAFT_1251518 [Mycena latifolia]
MAQVPPSEVLYSPKTPCRPRFFSPADGLSPAMIKRLEMSPRNGFVRIKIQYGRIYQIFDIKTDTPLRSALRKFSQKINEELRFLRFSAQGVRVREMDTASSLGMDERDTLGGNLIEVHLFQTGG